MVILKYFLISVFWERLFLSWCIWIDLTRSSFIGGSFKKIIELFLDLYFYLVLFLFLMFKFGLYFLILFICLLILFVFEFKKFFLKLVIFLLKLWIFLEYLWEFEWRLEEFFLIIFRIGDIIWVYLVFEYLYSFFVILYFLMKTHDLELKLLIFMVVFFNKDLCCFDSILSVETLRF